MVQREGGRWRRRSGQRMSRGSSYAAAAVLDYRKLYKLDEKSRLLMRDSKKLSEKQRCKLIPIIDDIKICTAIGTASVDEIDRYNILSATFLAMNRCIASLSLVPDVTLVDGRTKIKGFSGAQQPLVKGDDITFVIAAASNIAKFARDNHMRELGARHPEYGFESHVGYGTKRHLDALAVHGAIPDHRKSFAPVARAIEALDN